MMAKNIARIMAGVLTGIMAFGGLTGCGSDSTKTAAGNGGNQENEKVEIVFWNVFGGGEGDFVDQIVNEFNTSQDEIQVETIRMENSEFYPKYAAALASGKGPDVAVTHSDRLAPFVAANQLTELDSLADQIGFSFSEMSPINAAAVEYDGKHYSVPLDTHFHVCYYNKDILRQAGKLKEDGTPDFGELSPQGFRKFLDEVQEAVPDKKALTVNTPFFNQTFYNMYYQAGGDILTEDWSSAGIDNDKTRAVLDFYMSIYDDGVAYINDVNPYDTFRNGDSAIWMSGVWEAGNYFTEENGDTFGAVAIPPIFGGEEHWGSSHGLTIPAYVDDVKKEAGMKFMVYFAEKGALTWGNAGHVPAYTEVAESGEYKALPYREEFVKAQKTVKFAPQIANYNAVDTAVAEHLQTIIFKKVSVDEGLKAMTAEINSLLE